MKVTLFAALTLAGTAGQAAAGPSFAEVNFAALSISKDQGVRAIVSNVGTAPCPVQVSFLDADGSSIGSATTVRLKAGESTSVSASRYAKLVRAAVSIIDVGDAAKACALKASIEAYDQQTDVTLVAIPGEFVGGNKEWTSSVAPPLRATRKNIVQPPAPLRTIPSGGNDKLLR
jgi:hypothetical protein